MPWTEKTTIPASTPRITITMRSSTRVKPDSFSLAAWILACIASSPGPEVVSCADGRYVPCLYKPAFPDSAVFVGVFGILGLHRASTLSYTHLRAHETDSYLVCR